MSDIDNYLERNFGESPSKEAPCCGASNRLDHDIECRMRGTQINLPEWDKPIADLPKDRPQYISRGLSPEAKTVATDLYGAAEADRLLGEENEREEILDIVRILQANPEPEHHIQLVHIHGDGVWCPTCGNCDHSQKMDCPICGSYPLVILTKITITEHGDSVDTVTAHLVES